MYKHIIISRDARNNNENKYFLQLFLYILPLTSPEQSEFGNYLLDHIYSFTK